MGQTNLSARLFSNWICSVSWRLGVMKRLSKNWDWFDWFCVDCWLAAAAAICNGAEDIDISRPFNTLLAMPACECDTGTVDGFTTVWRRGNRSSCWRAAWKQRQRKIVYSKVKMRTAFDIFISEMWPQVTHWLVSLGGIFRWFEQFILRNHSMNKQISESDSLTTIHIDDVTSVTPTTCLKLLLGVNNAHW